MPFQKLEELTTFLESSVDGFTSDIPKLEKQVFARIQVLLKDLDLSRGTIKASVSNLRKINRIKREIENLTLNKKYIKEVDTFGQAFQKTTELQTSYFQTLEQGLKTPDFINVLQQTTIKNVKDSLFDLNQNVVQKAGDIIQKNITERATFSQLTEEMRVFLTDKNGTGALARHSGQIVRDSLNNYAAEYDKLISDDLNIQWFVYTGALVEDSRDFCVSLVKKKWVHKSEFGKVARGNFVPKPKSLQGMKPTKASTLQVNRGGYNCNHLLSPINEEFVPIEIRNKFK